MTRTDRPLSAWEAYQRRQRRDARITAAALWFLLILVVLAGILAGAWLASILGPWVCGS